MKNGIDAFKSSIYLDSGVDLADKGIGCKESNGACEKPESEYHDGRVSEVEQCWNEFGDFQFGHKVEN